MRLVLKAATLILLAPAALGVAGCSQPLGNDMSFAKVNKGYENTLTAEEKKAAIAEMKKDQEQARKAAGIEVETTASTKPAKKKQAEAAAQN